MSLNVGTTSQSAVPFTEKIFFGLGKMLYTRKKALRVGLSNPLTPPPILIQYQADM